MAFAAASQRQQTTDWGATPGVAGMRLIQLLPVNDTSVNMMWWDSYPYSSLSVSATPGASTRTAGGGSARHSVSWSPALCSTSPQLRWSASRCHSFVAVFGRERCAFAKDSFARQAGRAAVPALQRGGAVRGRGGGGRR